MAFFLATVDLEKLTTIKHIQEEAILGSLDYSCHQDLIPAPHLGLTLSNTV
jgi:hypothetical protein